MYIKFDIDTVIRYAPGSGLISYILKYQDSLVIVPEPSQREFWKHTSRELSSRIRLEESYSANMSREDRIVVIDDYAEVCNAKEKGFTGVVIFCQRNWERGQNRDLHWLKNKMHLKGYNSFTCEHVLESYAQDSRC